MNIHTIRKTLLALGGVFLSSITAQGQIDSGLLNYWPLDGNADDAAANVPTAAGTSADNGMINGSVTFTDAEVDGLGAGFGQVGNFPGGAGNNITVADPSGGTDDIDRSGADVSISVWIKASSWSTGWQAIIAHGEQSDYRIARRSDLDPVLFAYAGGTGDIQTITSYGAAPAGDGNWHHIVATTGNGGVTQLYVNGLLEATSTGVPTIAASDGNNNVLCIGCNPDNGREFNGFIDDIAMWDRVITADEVSSIHDNGRLGNPLSAILPAPGDDDNDGLPNSWEERYGLDPDDNGSTDPNNGPNGDPDNDNVSNIDEFNNNTFPNNDDTDGDGLTDGVETNNGENSYVSETDTGTNPLSPDSDGDGIDDGAEDNGGTFVSETETGTDPTVADSDADTMPDGYEVDNSQDPNSDDAALDPDSDELTNLDEFGLGTNPQVADSDMDGLDDAVEVNTENTDPNNPDSDGDTLSDGDEVTVHMTDPNSIDSDGDLFDDNEEVDGGSDPNDPTSTPVVPELPEPLLYYSFNVDNGTEVENLGTLDTPGVLQGGASYGEGQDASFGTAFVGNRTGANDAYVRTGFTGVDLGLGASSTTAGVYTAMAWINWNGTTALGGANGDHMIFGAEDGPGNNQQLHHGIRDEADGSHAHYGGWGNDLNNGGVVTPGEWTHLAFQYDGADKVIFINGIETLRGAGNPLGSETLPVIIGGHGRDAPDPAGQSFNGSIDEVKVYGAALSEAQVREAMIPNAGGGAGLVITEILFDPSIGANGQFSITFTSRQGASYGLYYSTDLFDFSSDVNDAITGQDGTTTLAFPNPDPGVSKLFFRVEAN